MAKAGKDLDAKLDALYGSPLADFTAARNALAKNLGASGRRDEAARVKALTKPSAAAWAVNQLAFSDKGLLEALVATGLRLRKNPGDLKEAMRERRDALNAAAKAAGRSLASSGREPNPDVQRRISATLESIAAHAGAEGGPRAGRLSEDVPAPGFDEIASLGLLGGAAPGARRTVPAPSTSAMPPRIEPPKIPSKKNLARERAAEKRREREAALRAAALKKDAQVARNRLAACEKAAGAASRRRASLEATLAEAAAEEKRLGAELAAARKEWEAADAAARDGTLPLTLRREFPTPRGAGR